MMSVSTEWSPDGNALNSKPLLGYKDSFSDRNHFSSYPVCTSNFARNIPQRAAFEALEGLSTEGMVISMLQISAKETPECLTFCTFNLAYDGAGSC
ncbi:hypothetical protein OGATHE_003512 [Ogataea polymorpha]|uniref:Uncharacterized protein n=1 Tax=Ogataea polymorpha TaxID=460523 RepID=A0A9P8P3U4_9ASCO|nr:hypothetical protein OGATHE_003512 [Ogataea polymorpha]